MYETRNLSFMSQIKSEVLNLVLRESNQNGRAETLFNCLWTSEGEASSRLRAQRPGRR